MPGVLTETGLVADEWLTGQLGRPVMRLNTDGLLEPPPVAGSRAAMIYCRVPVAATGLLGAMQRAGFRVVDTTLTLGRSRFGRCEVLSRCELRAAVPADRQPVTDLARRGFRWSRFHQDPAIPRAEADGIKAAWAANYFDGGRGDAMVVAVLDGRVAGFLLALAAGDGAMVVDLVAVDEAARGRRAAGDMTQYAQQYFPAAAQLRVGTQLANTAAVRAYQNMGFRVAGAEYVLHWHREHGGTEDAHRAH